MPALSPPPSPSLSERILVVVNRDPMDAPHRQRNDALLAVGVGVLSLLLGLYSDPALRPDALGWALLLGAVLTVAFRRRNPVRAFLAMVAFVFPYHALDNAHSAAIPMSMIVLYTVASTGRPLRTLAFGAMALTIMIATVTTLNRHNGIELLRTSGWNIAVLFCGVDVRVYRQYVASLKARAEKEAEQRVTDERMRIARDLHDLLAHSITLIGVQTSVASHILTVDPDRLDRATIAKALDGIAETCRTARGELRTTLEVLRADGAGGVSEPLPDLAALPGLVKASSAELDLRSEGLAMAPATEAAAYRIVQESLTNAVRHAGAGARVRVSVYGEGETLQVRIVDDGKAPGGTSGSGYGIIGMRERARSVGGLLTAGPRQDGGFEVRAELPLNERRLPE
ncbi:sensor histidine kinase [Streptomyces sp. NBC_01465]|uniref:sensor histidine kinase n=1 Tax=Streptomyces sp. NBC_01465 TaxID=2903878 RepID=UPI002E358A4D|nr:histidine kinase [Streptomyces sp. NBC_01465]